MKKRLLSTLLTLCMVLALLPGTARATVSSTDVRYDLSGSGDILYFDSSTGTITGCSASSESFRDVLNIPSQINGVTVTSIGTNAFENCHHSNIIIPDTVTTIDHHAFCQCHAVSIRIPDSVTTIGDCAFSACRDLANINISQNATSIGEYAFSDCAALTSITIPGSIDHIGYGAFDGCSNLANVDIQSGATCINGFVECSSLTNITIPTSVNLIGGGAFYCSGLTDITIPSSVTQIGASAFSATKLTSVTIPGSVERVGALVLEDSTISGTGPFADCLDLTSATLLEGVACIGYGSFTGCAKLASITIPKSVTSIEDYAFNGCENLSDIYFGGSENSWNAIERSHYTSGEDDTPRILDRATIHYNSTGPDDVKKETISGILRSGEGWSIRWSCDYQTDSDGKPKNGSIEITVNSTNTNEELYLYNEASDLGFPWELAPYNIPKSAIRKLVIRGQPDKRLRLTTNSFKGYSSLETVVFDYVSGVDSYAFDGCASLQFIGFLNNGSAFMSIGEGAFRNCSSLAAIDVPSELKSISAAAFQNTALEEITLGRNVTEIGDNAFSSCQNLLIRCYENSVAHKYAQENSIPYELISETLGYTNIYYGNGAVEPFEHNLDYYISQTASTTYNPTLSHMLIALSCAAYDESNITNSLKNLGFRNNDILTHYVPGDWSDDIAYTIGKKTMSNGENLVLIAIRGSSTSLDWLSNFAMGSAVAGCFWHAGFESATNKVYNDLTRLLDNDLTNTTFVVTGHSRGAAAANLLEVKLFNAGVAQNNVYGYNFACPDVATGLPTGWNWMGEHNNIFNIGNAPDPVAVIPGVLGSIVASAIPGSSWGKFGQSRWFSNDWNSLDETTLDLSFSAHDQDVYLKYLRKEPAFSSFKTWESRKATLSTTQIQTIGKLFGICCPVDVLITDGSGNPVASVINNVTNYYDSTFGDVIIFEDEDKKIIFVNGNDPVTLHLTATDSGTMEYIIQTVDVGLSEVLSEKSFSNVTLVDGKQMLSVANVDEITGTGTDVSRVPLYVVDENDTPQKEVLPDGKGTEVPIDTPITPDNTHVITFNPNGGTVTPTSLTTNANGKLPSLPTPTRSGYTFNGWFMASSGGVAVTSDTKFTESVTVYAHWTYITADRPSGGGSSSYDDYTPPIYSITAPSAIGGSVSISPKSASKGNTITLTVKPDNGYKLVGLTATDKNGKTLALSDKGNGKYTFTMPSGKVTVDAVFQLIQPDEPEPETPWHNPFTDISESAWYYDAVKFVSENSLMNGYGNGIFAPDAYLSRSMLAQVLYNREGRPVASGNNAFSDVSTDAWYSEAVAWAAERGIVSGYGNGLFGPGDNITREQLAVMLWRYAGKPAATNKELYFNDADEVSGYALDALCWAVENGIINGKGGGILDPRGQATRAQVAQILMNYLRK